jgi:hypothetical protein
MQLNTPEIASSLVKSYNQLEGRARSLFVMGLVRLAEYGDEGDAHGALLALNQLELGQLVGPGGFAECLDAVIEHRDAQVVAGNRPTSPLRFFFIGRAGW